MRVRLESIRWWAMVAILLVIGAVACAIWVDNLQLVVGLGLAAIAMAILSLHEGERS